MAGKGHRPSNLGDYLHPPGGKDVAPIMKASSPKISDQDRKALSRERLFDAQMAAGGYKKGPNEYGPRSNLDARIGSRRGLPDNKK